MISLIDYIDGRARIPVTIGGRTYKLSWPEVDNYDVFLKENHLEPSDDTFTLWDDAIKKAVDNQQELFGHKSPANAHAGSVFERLGDSLSWKQLANELEKHFGYKLVSHVKSRSDYATIFKMDVGDDKDVSHSEDLRSFLACYNYYIERVNDKDSEHIIVSIAPWKSKSANDLVYKECNGILYHAVFKKELEKIKKYGLSPRAVFKEVGWERPYRRFFIANKDEKEAIEEVKSIARLKARAVNDRMEAADKQYRVANDDIVVLRIDLSKVFDVSEPPKPKITRFHDGTKIPYASNDKRYNFYHDPSSEGYDSVYTVDTIHPKAVEVIGES